MNDGGLVPVPLEDATASTAAKPLSEASTRSSAVDPIEQELRFHRAIAASLDGDHQQALQTLGSPSADDTAAIYASAIWNLEDGDLAAGVEMLEQIASRPDAPAEVHKMLAVGYLHLDYAKHAEAAADAYLNRKSDDRYAQYVRGLAILRQDDTDRARDALRQAGYDDEEVDEIQLVMMQVPVDVNQRRSTINNTLGTARRSTARRSNTRSRGQDRNYNFTILFAGEYDSNVTVDEVDLTSSESDYALVLDAGKVGDGKRVLSIETTD